MKATVKVTKPLFGSENNVHANATYVTNGHFMIRAARLVPSGDPITLKAILNRQIDGELNPTMADHVLAKCARDRTNGILFVRTPIVLEWSATSAGVCYVSEGGDSRMIERRYANAFELDQFYGTSDPSVPLVDDPVDRNLIIMPHRSSSPDVHAAIAVLARAYELTKPKQARKC